MDIYGEITNRIMDQLNQGIIPWQKPWQASGSAISHVTGKPYSLLNQMLLGKAGEYATYKQVQQEGGWVRKGEKASMVVFWRWIDKEDEETGEVKQVPCIVYLGFERGPYPRKDLLDYHKCAIIEPLGGEASTAPWATGSYWKD